jgi:hypothetical protein
LKFLVFEAFSYGIKISSLTNFAWIYCGYCFALWEVAAQRDMIRIVYDPNVDEEPIIQLTEKGKQEVIDLLFTKE